MGGGKRKNKKLARKQNNAGGKYVPKPNPVSDNKAVPVAATEGGDYRELYVRWTAREIDRLANDGRRWDLNAKETIELLKFLDELTNRTWGEWESERTDGRKRHHDHAITDLNSEAQDRLQELEMNEERIFRFRLSGPCRLWGFRSGALFRVLWYDPEHAVYPVSKRHT